MKFEDAINGQTIEYKRWHVGVRGDIVIDNDVHITITKDEAANFISGLRGEQQIVVWDDTGQDALISKSGGNIRLQQRYINRHGGFSIKRATLSQEDAIKIADDIQDMIDNRKDYDAYYHHT